MNARVVPEAFDYPAAARSIALHLAEWCDESLPYPQMIAEAARRAKRTLDIFRNRDADNALSSAPETNPLRVALLDIWRLTEQRGPLWTRDHAGIALGFKPGPTESRPTLGVRPEPETAVPEIPQSSVLRTPCNRPDVEADFNQRASDGDEESSKDQHSAGDAGEGRRAAMRGVRAEECDVASAPRPGRDRIGVPLVQETGHSAAPVTQPPRLNLDEAITDELLTAFQKSCERVVTEGDSRLSATTKERAILRNELRAQLLRAARFSQSSRVETPDEETGVSLIAAERARQVAEEGWRPQHADDHIDGELAQAAAMYALPEAVRFEISESRTKEMGWPPEYWPFEEDWWKPTPNDRVRELVKAGALIAAEIDRLRRAARSGGRS